MTTTAANDRPAAVIVPLPHCRSEPRPPPSRESQHGLDWFIFFLADVQTGFGPFIAVYLTTQKWTQVEIGFVLSIGGIVGLLGQMPGGAIVDAARSERLVAGLAVAAIGMSALGLCGVADLPGGDCGRDPACAGELRAGSCDCRDQSRPGRPACDRRAARPQRPLCLARQRLGGSPDGRLRLLLSNRSVFLVTFLLAIPTLLALWRIREREIDIVQAHGAIAARSAGREGHQRRSSLIRQRPLLIFAGSILLLQLANAAMLPLMAGVVTTRSSQWAPVLIAACIIVPQAIVALMSPSVGRKAQAWGRRPLLLIGFAALAIRGLLFAS